MRPNARTCSRFVDRRRDARPVSVRRAHDVPDPGREPAGAMRPQPDLWEAPDAGCFYLYVLLPSRCVVGWMVAERTPRSPRRCRLHGLQLLADPHPLAQVSDDNPYLPRAEVATTLGPLVHGAPEGGSAMSDTPQRTSLLRRNQRSHPCYTKPELVATGPNHGPGITRLRGPKRWTSFPLCLARHLQPLHLDGCRSGERRARRTLIPVSSKASSPRAHPAFGPRPPNQQVHRSCWRPSEGPQAADLPTGIRQAGPPMRCRGRRSCALPCSPDRTGVD